MLKNKSIDENTVSWKEVSYNHPYVYSIYGEPYDYNSYDGIVVGAHRDKVKLDDIEAPPNHLLTGVRFQFHDDSWLALEAQFTKFIFTSDSVRRFHRTGWISYKNPLFR